MISKIKQRAVLTVSMLLISSCGCLPKAPNVRLKQIMQRLGVCKEYVAVFGDKLTFKYDNDIPIEECLVDGYFILTDTEIVEIRKAYNDAKKCIETEKKKCKK